MLNWMTAEKWRYSNGPRIGKIYLVYKIGLPYYVCTFITGCGLVNIATNLSVSDWDYVAEINPPELKGEN